ncbi:MAG TPA: hypothetical protein VIK75_02080 [Calditerricola sp.]
MNEWGEIEELLRRDREAGVPEPPDPRYTIAAVKRRLQGNGKTEEPRSAGWLLLAAGLGVALCAGLLAVHLGLDPWWLWLAPLLSIPAWPILLRKGVEER